MSGQFENSENSDQPNDPKDGQTHCLVILLTFISYDGTERNKIRHNRYNIDNIHDITKKDEFDRTSGEANEKFAGKPHDATRLDYKKRVVEGRDVILDDDVFRSVARKVSTFFALHFVMLELRKRFQAENDNRQ